MYIQLTTTKLNYYQEVNYYYQLRSNIFMGNENDKTFAWGFASRTQRNIEKNLIPAKTNLSLKVNK